MYFELNLNTFWITNKPGRISFEFRLLLKRWKKNMRKEDKKRCGAEEKSSNDILGALR